MTRQGNGITGPDFDRENIFGPILFEMRGRCSAVGDEDQGGDSINYGTALDPPGLPTLQYYQK